MASVAKMGPSTADTDTAHLQMRPTSPGGDRNEQGLAYTTKVRLMLKMQLGNKTTPKNPPEIRPKITGSLLMIRLQHPRGDNQEKQSPNLEQRVAAIHLVAGADAGARAAAP